MQKRFIFALMMTVVLLAGTWSSITCEAACLPQAQTGLCCPSQRTVTDCDHSTGPSWMAMHDCSHKQDQGAAASLNLPASMQMIQFYASTEALPSNSLQAVHSSERTHDFFLNRPSNLPLRI